MKCQKNHYLQFQLKCGLKAALKKQFYAYVKSSKRCFKTKKGTLHSGIAKVSTLLVKELEKG